MRRATALRPDEHDWLLDLAKLESRARRFEEACRTLERAEACRPGDASIPALRAEICRKLRRGEEVERAVGAALALDPAQSLALTVRARERLRAGDLDGAQADAEGAIRGAVSDAELGAAHHLRGDVLERRGRFDDAFDAHMAGNMARARGPSVRALLDDPFPRRLGLYTEHPDAPSFYRRWGARRYDDDIPAPLILAGFPRSGTTLGEQILAAHPGVTSTEEEEHTAPVIARMLAMFDRSTARHHLERLDALTDEQVMELRRVYRDSVERAVPERERGLRIVDKHPFRLNDLGLINRIFPEARVIVMIRDPRDVCVSALFQNFELNPGLVRFLWVQTTARWYGALMGFWLRIRGMLTLDLMEVRYEDLVGDFEPNARAMLEFIGADWHDDVARFHEIAGSRTVTSASYNAVTQGVNSRSVGRWKRYASRLGPIMEAATPVIEAYGYEPAPGP